MLRIGDFARLAGVSVRMLRHYDTLGLLCPAKTDQFTGYRYYDAAQLERANQLVALKELGFALNQVGTMLADDLSRDDLARMLRTRIEDLNRQLSADQYRLGRVEAKLHLIERDHPMSTTVYTETNLPALRLVQLAARVKSMEEIEAEIGGMFDRVNSIIDAAGASRVGPGVAHYSSQQDDVVAAAAEQIGEAAVPDGLEGAQLPAVARALSAQYVGDDLNGIQAAWQGLMVEVQQRGFEPTADACREIYLETPFERPGGRWVVDLQQPIRSA